MYSQAICDRFWTKVDHRGACWFWQDGRSPHGYGVFNPFKGKTVRAHRFAWELTHGPIPEGIWVLHKCDNPPCCNPDHLFLGTVQDNVADSIAKKRNSRGSRHTGAKLHEDSVRAIRAVFASKGATQYQLARWFGVTRSAIQQITQNKNWKHLLVEQVNS